METKKLLEEASKYLLNTYNRQPVVLRKGRGMRVLSADGKEYLDFVGGIAVNVLGHCPRRVVVALQKQAQRLLHVSNLYYIEPQIKLAKALVEHSFADRVFFCNSGTEAVEAAIKLARKYSRYKYGDPERYEIISTLNSFHGRTYGALSATGQRRFHQGFEPLLEGFRFVPYENVEALEAAITERTCAVVLEPVQAEGGVRVPSLSYLREVREVCHRHGLLLILDEVQTGMGRTGELFAYKHFGIRPDVMALAKGLGAGVPIGAMLCTEEVAQAMAPGEHGSTFGGGPLVCAAALATLHCLLEDNQYLVHHARRMGELLLEGLRALKERFSHLVLDVRGMGLLLGVELRKPCAPVVEACLKEGLLINCTAETVLRLTPPLVVQEADIREALGIMASALERIS